MQKFLGLDFSMHELYRDSNGKEPAYPGYYRNAEKKLAREQRKLSKMQKGSNNRNKQRLKVAKLHEKVSNQRKDFLHKQSRQIANAYDAWGKLLSVAGSAASLRPRLPDRCRYHVQCCYAGCGAGVRPQEQGAA